MINRDLPIFALVLNPMQGNTENRALVAWSHSREALEAFEKSQLVEPYTDEGRDTFEPGTKMYHKVYLKGGPLEWFNPLSETIYHSHPPGGILEYKSVAEVVRHHAERIALDYEQFINQGTCIPS